MEQTPDSPPAAGPLERAAQIADNVLFPAALSVDAADRTPAGSLDLLAAEGFYGMVGPAEYGGAALDLEGAFDVVEALAGGCLSTAFVWGQHHGAVRAVAASIRPRLRDRWLRALCTGDRRAGAALTGGLLDPPRLRARQVDGGYLFEGTTPWVSGWGMIDVIHTAARVDDDTVAWALLDAVAAPTLLVEPLPLGVVAPTSTVHLRFTGHFVANERVLTVTPYAEWRSGDLVNVRLAGALALGVTARCCRLIGPSPLDRELADCRAALRTGQSEALPAARAAASELAMRAASALVVSTGSGSVLRDTHAQRLAREALFLLVFGSRRAIREALIARLTGTSAPRTLH